MKQIEKYFRSLADISRLRIINLLLRGELCGCDIHRVLDTAQPNVSRHLNYLKNSGVVRDRRDGYRVYYRLVDPAPRALEALFGYLRQTFAAEEVLRRDLQKLHQAVANGACSTAIPQEENQSCPTPLS